MKIPKIIYTTWISDKQLPEKLKKYIDSWNRFMPDYEIRMITLDNVPHNRFTDTFIGLKKFAVAAQYARAQRIFETGGLYFDVDVEAVKSFDDFLDYEMFAGIETKADNDFVNNAVFGACKEHPFLREYMEELDKIDFSRKDIEVSTGPLLFTRLLKGRGWIPKNKSIMLNGIKIFSSEYFYPFCPDEQFTSDCITKNTRAVHHWAATWKNSVSIIILSGHHTEQMTDIIEVAARQTVKPIEIIVINGNYDNSRRLPNNARKFKVKFVNAENRNVSSAKNAGVEFAKGRWILILKPGDKIERKFIEKTIDKGDIVGLKSANPRNCQFSISTGNSFLVRKEVWETLNGFDEKMNEGNEDYDFLDRAQLYGFSVNIISE